MRIINSGEATIDDAFEVAQLMIEEGDTEHGGATAACRRDCSRAGGGRSDHASYRRVRSEV
jgi:hypothetical protein